MITAVLILFGGTGCDTIEPVDSSTLVVEGYLNTGAPLPDVLMHHTVDPEAGFVRAEAAILDASVDLTLGGEFIRYEPHPSRPGAYRPLRTDVATAAGTTYRFQATWRDAHVETQGVLPPAIKLQDVEIKIPEEPVSAVFLDSLALNDTLATGAYTGYIYPIEVVVEWDEPAKSIPAPWVRVQLKPYAPFSSTVIDLFLESDVVLPETEQDLTPGGARTWTGVYAIGVPDANSPLPEHLLRVSVVRSGKDYAQFASSREKPDRREPITNLNGAVGIFAALSVDSLHVSVSQPDR